MFSITSPAVNGTYDLYYDMVWENATWFRQQSNVEWKQPLIVATQQNDVDTDGDGFPDLWEASHGRLWWHPGAGTFQLDFDVDGDMDQEDFGQLQICLNNRIALPMPPQCQFADLNGDGLVDQSDFGIFQPCMSGPGLLADPTCAD